MNIVPTPRVRSIAAAMIRDAEKMAGADVVILHMENIRQDQLPALVGVLLTATKQHKKPGRPATPATLSTADRMRGYRLYKQGDRTTFARTANREYQRIIRARKRTRDGQLR